MRLTFFASLLAAFTLALGVTSAAAFPIAATPGGNITAIEDTFTFEGPIGVSISCDVTMTGTLSTTIARAGATIATINSVTLSGCNYPTRADVTTPWTLTANSHTTPLTVIGANLAGVVFEVRNLPIVGPCTFAGGIAFNAPVSSGVTSYIGTLASTLSSTCQFVVGRVAAGQTFALSPNQTMRA
ncbi:hypothetical protein VSS74_28540 [Conexibacter stalactiti]|uniref:Protein activator of alkane oxidation PraB n=1 Tax=Conexibacter stalactiti TaxID=1940611 RepID=A0ABU4HYD7_9ACTN|nr:hypothetical protein [Conexibacter stalactiti]MDW5598341.1 hypothetical protein [Conexibacter stalactiti]MEC5038983.1 hypothetical protein [Conexibacter stalactiti]